MASALAVVSVTSLMANKKEIARLETLHGKIDANDDSSVSNQEFLDFWEKRFNRLDKNMDGIIDDSEDRVVAIKNVDENGDGNASLEEELKLRQRFFTSMDKDADGSLTLSELQQSSTKSKEVSNPKSKNVDLSAERATVESLSGLTDAPKMWLAEGFDSTDDLAAIYFDALDWKGEPTKVFAWLGLPENREDKVPGVVLVHGGGGTAFKEWVKLWTDRGYAAISIAVEGQTDRKDGDAWISHEWAGPKRSGIYGDLAEPLKDQWMYHAVADTVFANSLLRSLPEVDAEKVGVMGISWGGVITSTVIGIDDRFAFAIPTYGCGDLSTAGNQYGRSLGKKKLYKRVWDPILRMEKAQMPTLWYSWPGDDHFPLDLQASCYAAQPGQQMVSLVPKMGHGHGSAWARPESYAFADSVVQKSEPWCVQKSAALKGDDYEVVFRSNKKLGSAELVSTTDSGVTGSRTWVQTPLSKPVVKGRNWKVTAQIPAGSTAWFINVKHGELVVSSDFTEAN